MSLTPEMIADGWIEHDGGPCPVDGHVNTTVMFKDGTTDTAYADFWSASGDPEIDDMWEGDCASYDHIIAYKPESPSHDQ